MPGRRIRGGRPACGAIVARMTTELLLAIATAGLAASMLLGIVAQRMRPRAVRARVQPRPVNRSIER